MVDRIAVLGKVSEAELEEMIAEKKSVIDAALARIKNGTYGDCAGCGCKISAERLEAVPHAALCRNCA